MFESDTNYSGPEVLWKLQANPYHALLINQECSSKLSAQLRDIQVLGIGQNLTVYSDYPQESEFIWDTEHHQWNRIKGCLPP